MISIMILIIYTQDFLDIQDHISYDFSTKGKFLSKSNKVRERAAQGASFLWSLFQRERGVQG